MKSARRPAPLESRSRIESAARCQQRRSSRVAECVDASASSRESSRAQGNEAQKALRTSVCVFVLTCSRPGLRRRGHALGVAAELPAVTPETPRLLVSKDSLSSERTRAGTHKTRVSSVGRYSLFWRPPVQTFLPFFLSQGAAALGRERRPPEPRAPARGVRGALLGRVHPSEF